MVFLSVVIAAFLLVAGHSDGPLAGSPDSALRLVEVRDFLAGQGWFDLTQYRMAPPAGVVMHWSRLVDLPLALLIRLADAVPGVDAERLAVNLWPVLLAVGFMVTVASLALRRGGTTAAAATLLLVAFSPSLVAAFRPGNIDHHNVQLVLVGLMMAGLVSLESRGGALLAAAAAAASLAVGLEQLVLVAAAGGLVALRWLWVGPPAARPTAVFGATLAAGTSALWVATVPPERLLVPACDALSLPYVAAASIGGIGLALLALLLRHEGVPTPMRLLRLLALAGLAALAIGTVAWVSPACLAGPYAEVDPRLYPIWLDHVGEARGLGALLRSNPAGAIGHYGPPLAVLVAVAIALLRGAGALRTPFALLGSLLAAALLVAALQVRGAATAAAIAAPLAGLLIAEMRRGSDPGLRGIALRLGGVVFVPLVWWSLGQALLGRVEAATVPAGCSTSLVTALAPLAPGLVAAPSNHGSDILLGTRHAVLAAPYHRNAAGLLAAADLWQASPAAVAASLEREGVAYVAFCLGGAEERLFTRLAPAGLLAALSAGRVPPPLAPVAAEGAARVFAVRDPLTTGSFPPVFRGTLAEPSGLVGN